MALPVRRMPTQPSTRWDPFGELEDLHLPTGQLLDSIVSGPESDRGTWAPPVDVEETEDAWIVEAELLGEADPERIKADLHDGVLTVRVPKPEGSRPRQHR